MTSDITRPPEKQYNYSNVFTGLVGLVKSEGVQGLLRGLGTNVVSKICALRWCCRLNYTSEPGYPNERTFRAVIVESLWLISLTRVFFLGLSSWIVSELTLCTLIFNASS